MYVIVYVVEELDITSNYSLLIKRVNQAVSCTSSTDVANELNKDMLRFYYIYFL